MAEDEGADRARDEAHEIDAEGAERRCERRLVRKEELAEDEPGHRAVEEKIIPLDGGADGGGDDGATKLARVLVGAKSGRYVRERGHWHPPCDEVRRMPDGPEEGSHLSRVLPRRRAPTRKGRICPVWRDPVRTTAFVGRLGRIAWQAVQNGPGQIRAQIPRLLLCGRGLHPVSGRGRH